VGDSGDDWVPSSDENVEEEPLSEYELLDEESSEQYSSDTSSSLSVSNLIRSSHRQRTLSIDFLPRANLISISGCINYSCSSNGSNISSALGSLFFCGSFRMGIIARQKQFNQQ